MLLFICYAGLALDRSRSASLQVLLAAPQAAYEPGALDTLQRVVPVAELPCASATAQGGAAALRVSYTHYVLKLCSEASRARLCDPANPAA